MITVDKIIKLQEILINTFGGTFGIRDKGLLESAVLSAYASYDGAEFYPTIEEKSARLAFSLIKNHSFIDGNKRIGIYVMIILLEKNNIFLNATTTDLVDLGVGLASSKYDYSYALEFINKFKQK